jgi:hypothetical protein
MTLLGAVVFGGLLGIAVLWLLVTAPASEGADMSDVDAWDHSQWQEPSNFVSLSAGPDGSSPCAATHSSQK